MKKTHKVVTLSTEKSNITLGTGSNSTKDKLHFSSISFDKGKNNQPQHLYIISEDKIKEGDWWYNASTGLIWKVTADNVKCYNQPSNMDKTGLNKIVATTDKELQNIEIGFTPGFHNDACYKIPESFIQAYIKAYNEGKPITEVDLEMTNHEQETGEFAHSDAELELYIKTRPDNTVIVHQSKMYSKEEMIKLIQGKIDEYGGDAQGDIEYIALFCFQDWIEDNL